jgi:hypothetical protein
MLIIIILMITGTFDYPKEGAGDHTSYDIQTSTKNTSIVWFLCFRFSVTGPEYLQELKVP